MERRLYQELWRLRFQKMLSLENQSARDYEELLEECGRHHRDHAIRPHLERLVRDEKKHALLVEELLKILDRQPE